MEMKASKVLEKLHAGKAASCIKINTADHRVVEISAMAGFDCIWTDMEHTPNSIETVERQVLAAKAHGTDIVVRVRRGSYSDHIYPLELDSTGIMVPHIMSYEDAKNIVRMTRFHPIGRRPLDGGNADGAYCMIDTVSYMKQANERRFVIIQIEDPEPLAELDAICALPGIDIIFFGPGDFSQGIGAPGVWDHPELLRVRKLVAETAIKHGKYAGTVGGLNNMRELYDMGYRFLSIGADVLGLGAYFNEIIRAFHDTFTDHVNMY